jgi:hypothetical protein
MIDWRISPEFESLKERAWFFASFEIQEYLLPQINVGKPFIDIYDDTTFTSEDCVRLMGNIRYLLDSGTFDVKPELQFDSFEKGVVALSCQQLKDCLINLHEAASLAAQRGGVLKFYGD